MFRKLFAAIFIVALCFALYSPQDSEAWLWGSKNETSLTYHSVADTSSSLGTGETDSLAVTVLNHSGSGKIYMISVKSENSTGIRPICCFDCWRYDRYYDNRKLDRFLLVNPLEYTRRWYCGSSGVCVISRQHISSGKYSVWANLKGADI